VRQSRTAAARKHAAIVTSVRKTFDRIAARTPVAAALSRGGHMRKWFEIGGIFASVILIVFGIVAIVMGINGRNTVQDNLKLEQIQGTPDMTPSAIRAEAQKAGLPSTIAFPNCSVAGEDIDTGNRARCFAQFMRIHALEATGGVVYAQMPRYATADGKGTNDPTAAQKGPNGQPLDNQARQVWINYTALSTALNTAYMAEQIALFGIATGVAMLLAGIGFGILSLSGAVRGADSSSFGIVRHFGGHEAQPSA
jgi:hypothetical protein